MDVVYPYKKRRDNSELRYSLRSLVNLRHDDVWVIGDKPVGFCVNRINQSLPGYNYANVCNNVIGACHDKRISDPFIVMNDDFFIMAPVETVDVLWRETLAEALTRYSDCNMGQWFRNTSDIMRVFPEAVRSYELHVPMVVHKDAMIEGVAKTGLGPMWRTAYGAVMDLHGEQAEDVKVRKVHDPLPAGPYLSTSDASWDSGPAGEFVRSSFESPCQYEVMPQI